jgi:hypothetical protein
MLWFRGRRNAEPSPPDRLAEHCVGDCFAGRNCPTCPSCGQATCCNGVRLCNVVCRNSSEHPMSGGPPRSKESGQRLVGCGGLKRGSKRRRSGRSCRNGRFAVWQWQALPVSQSD